MSKNVDIVPKGENWAVKKENSLRASKVVSTQKKAISIGRGQAIRTSSELIIHGKDGKIREKNSYGHDPSSIKG